MMKNCLSALKLILTLKCEQSTRLVSDSLDRELSLVERWAVRLHYIGCWSCRRFGKQIRLIQKALQMHSKKIHEEAKLSPEATKNIRDAIERENLS